MPKNKAEKENRMSWDEIQRVVCAEVDAARDSSSRASQIDRREKAWDRYYGRKLGNEKKGRSQFITRDVMDTIEWMMPFFMKTFAYGDPRVRIEIKGQPEFVGKGLMDKIQLDLDEGEPTSFLLMYQWFKDSLVSNTSYVKVGWKFEEKVVTVDFDDLSRINMIQLLNDPDVKVAKIEEITGPFQMPVYRATAKVKQIIEDRAYADNTPNWEFLVSPKSRDMNDEYGKGQMTEVTLDYLRRINRSMSTPDKPFFEHLDELETPIGQTERAETNILEGEKASYMGEDQVADENVEPETGAKTPITLKEWYTRLDVNGDGYLEDVVCWIANNKLIRWEENEEDFIPWAAIRPIIDCYKFYGISFAELVIEIQNLKTMLFRRILDMFDFQVQGRWRVDPDGSVDLYALYNHAPGGAIPAKQGSVENLYTTPFDPNNFRILEYVDSIKENRTGVSRYNQGMDADSLNKTATGIVQIQSAAMQRMELVANLFAEGSRDFYKKLVYLYQRYLKRPFAAKVHGKEVQITPDMIQGKVICTVNMGVQASAGMEEALKIERMFGFLVKINQLYPGLLNPEKIHNLCRRYITSLGFKQVGDFITDLDSYLQEIKKAMAGQQQQQQFQQQLIALETRLKQMEIAVKKQDSDTKRRDVELDAQLESQKLGQDLIIEREKIAQDERDSVRDFRVDMFNAMKPEPARPPV